jgi:hypothetical protein
MSKRDNFVAAIKTRVGRPYVFGTSGPDTFDCSGLVCYGFRECCMPLPMRMNSTQLANRYEKNKIEPLQAPPGALFFYGDSPTKINHVMVVVDHWDGAAGVALVGARGGDRTVNSVEKAREKAAFVDCCFADTYQPTKLQLAVDPFAGVD